MLRKVYSHPERICDGVLKRITGSSEALENIKMAYWWAGYYSGLYEGQQETTDAVTTQEQQET